MDREPIFWVSTSNGSNARERERIVMKDGQKRIERFPQRGHQGDYDDKRPANGVRSYLMVRHDGHTIHMAMTNAAAHLDPTTTFGQYQLAKARHLGWFRLGQCPCAMLLTGDLVADHIVNKAMLKEAPCAPGTYTPSKPCPHALAEQAARQKSHGAYEAKRMAGFKDATEKLVEAGNEQTEKLIGAITDAIAGKTKGKATP